MENSTLWNVTSATADLGLTESTPAFQVAFTLILVIIMFGMGCAVDHKVLIANLKKPVGICVGLCCQIFLMPLLTYAIVKISSMTAIQSLTLVLVGCSPGGSNSNIITYLINGDISLSVAMTSFSSLLALGTVPGWILLYNSIENNEDSLQIPFSSLGISLVAMVVPIVLGILFRKKFPRPSRYIPRVCAGIGILALIAAIFSFFFVTKLEFQFSADTILPTAILPAAGMVIPFLIASIPKLKLSSGSRKAITIEVAIQNAGLANAILILTFGDRMELIAQVLTIPFIYNVSQGILCLLIVAIYRLWYCVTGRQRRRKERGGKCSREGVDISKDHNELGALCETHDT